ncbi:MAG: hypothetical protein WKG01_36760 [Kofleriaceae bacterium]
MPSRPDLREIATNVRDAFADADRDTLLEILTFVVKEYVVEGPPPMLIHQAETLADLKTASFAQLVSALQTRFDFPELAMFVVDGEQVSVRVGGVVQPLLAARQPLTPTADLPRPQAGVRVVETTLQQQPRPAAPPQQPVSGQAPPPVRGLTTRGRPSVEPGAAPQSAAPAAPAASAPTQPTGPAPAPERSDKPEGSGDDASARFSLLELD